MPTYATGANPFPYWQAVGEPDEPNRHNTYHVGFSVAYLRLVLPAASGYPAVTAEGRSPAGDAGNDAQDYVTDSGFSVFAAYKGVVHKCHPLPCVWDASAMRKRRGVPRA